MNKITPLLFSVLVLTLPAFTPALRAQVTPTLTTLDSFGNGNGSFPAASLVQGSDGNFYGTTEQGGSNNHGTVFRMTPAGVLTVLHSFTGSGPDGSQPYSGLVQGGDGNFYGTTSGYGSDDNVGTVFRITSAGVLTTLYSFPGGEAYGTGPDGAYPYAGLVQGNDGNFYGTTFYGGGSSAGTVFRVTPAGVLTVLHNFTGSGPDGAGPAAGLIQGSDGNFYGTTSGGSGSYNGTVFRLTPAGMLTTLYIFPGDEPDNATGPDGAYPNGLIQGRDGNFYGTAALGGSSNHGTVFRITPAGALTLLHSFTGPEGVYPVGGLIQASDGNFYGTTNGAGDISSGTIFEMTPAGTLTVLHSFTGGTDGAGPAAALIQGRDGNLYGTTSGMVRGHAYDAGTVFRLNVVPAITSAATAAGMVGHPLTYQIMATNVPTRFGFQGNANGLTIDAATGVISGTPKASGTFTYTLNAYNSVGKGSAPLTLTIQPDGPPVVTSASSASGKMGVPFSYQIIATNSPTRFGFQGNANGLTINSSTGLISGVPKAAGSFPYTLNAYNAAGKGSVMLTVTVEAE